MSYRVGSTFDWGTRGIVASVYSIRAVYLFLHTDKVAIARQKLQAQFSCQMQFLMKIFSNCNFWSEITFTKN